MQSVHAIRDENELDDILSEPQPATVETIRRLDGDFMILGIGGKMGPTLGMMLVKALRAAGKSSRVYGVSRFSDPVLALKLETGEISCLSCDLLKPEEVERLPVVPNVIYMAGRKFGKVGTDHLYWAMNAVAPANAARRFPEARIVAFSTGSIYDLRPVESEGPVETDTFTSLGEYANSCLARERIFEYYSRLNGTGMLQVRLNYAAELRYGVLLEIGKQVYEGRPIDLTMGFANVIWQGDANNIALRCFEKTASPPEILNVSGEKFSVREAALRFGELLGREPRFTGTEAPDALLTNTEKLRRWFGEPPTSRERMIQWIAGWIDRGGGMLGKPTHFQTRDGQFLER